MRLFLLAAIFPFFCIGAAAQAPVTGNRLEITNTTNDATFILGKNNPTAYYSLEYSNVVAVVREYYNYNGTTSLIADKSWSAII